MNSDIHLALFCGENHPAGKRLEAVLGKKLAADELRIFRTLRALDRGFRRPGHATEILVLCPSTDADLLGLVRIRHLLMNVRIILVLPDRAGDTIAQGHTLYPRYVSYADGDFSDVAAVLDKMLRNGKTGSVVSSARSH